MKVWVLMGNDFPAGVYSSEEKGNAAKAVNEDQHVKRGGTPLRVYWRLYEFEVDAE